MKKQIRSSARRQLCRLGLSLTMIVAAATAAHAQPKAPDVSDGIFTQGEFFIGCNYWAKNAGMYMWSQWRPDEIGRAHV